MKSWFIRHWSKDTHGSWNNEQNSEIQQRLFDKKEIAVHYKSICSVNPDDYEKNHANVIRRFLKLAKEGGYICAHYPAIRRTVIGKVNPNTKIKCEKKNFCLKRIKLEKCEEIFGERKEFLLAAKPRQGTLSYWPNIGNLLGLIVNREPITESLELLTPSIQEAVCQEYLRHKHGLRYLLLPFGRNAEVVDILGMTERGIRIFDQVTNSKNQKDLEDKAARLMRFQKEMKSRKFFFCPESDAARKTQRKFPNLKFIWLENVMKWLKLEHANYKNVLFSWL